MEVNNTYKQAITFRPDLSINVTPLLSISEVAFMIFSLLDIQTLLKSAQVCKSWKLIVDDEMIWKKIAKSLDICPELKIGSESESIQSQVKSILLQEKGKIIVRTRGDFFIKLFEIYKKADLEKITEIQYFSGTNKRSKIKITIGNIEKVREQHLPMLGEPPKPDHVYAIKGKSQADFIKKLENYGGFANAEYIKNNVYMRVCIDNKIDEFVRKHEMLNVNRMTDYFNLSLNEEELNELEFPWYLRETGRLG
jgi:hypothetical protein